MRAVDFFLCVRSSSREEKSDIPKAHRALLSSGMRIFSASDRDFLYWVVFWKPWSTQRNNPPAEYWVNEARVSSAAMGVFEWEMAAEGMRMVEPAGNSMARLSSHSTMWPPRVWSNLPSAVMLQIPNGRLAASRCLPVTVLGPKLNAAAAHTLFLKLGVRWPWRAVRVSRQVL